MLKSHFSCFVIRSECKESCTSDSPMLVDFAITAKNSVLHLSNRQVKFFEEFKL